MRLWGIPASIAPGIQDFLAKALAVSQKPGHTLSKHSEVWNKQAAEKFTWL